MLHGRTPHPAALVAASAATGRRLQASDVDDAGAPRPKGPGVKSYMADGVAAYRFPDGRTFPAYDMYSPDHPAEAEPGIARIRYEAQHFPNDTSGYRAHVLGFRSVSDFEADGQKIDRTAAGMILHDGAATGVMTGSEEEMRQVADNLPEGAVLKRGTILHADIDEGGPINHVLMTSTPANGLEVHAATEPEALLKALRERFSFLPEGEGLENFQEIISEQGRKFGWAVAAGTRTEMEPDAAMRPTPGPDREEEDGPGL